MLGDRPACCLTSHVRSQGDAPPAAIPRRACSARRLIRRAEPDLPDSFDSNDPVSRAKPRVPAGAWSTHGKTHTNRPPALPVLQEWSSGPPNLRSEARLRTDHQSVRTARPPGDILLLIMSFPRTGPQGPRPRTLSSENAKPSCPRTDPPTFCQPLSAIFPPSVPMPRAHL